MTRIGKIGAAALSALVLGGGVSAPLDAAQARNGRNAALAGGLAAGAVVGGAIAGATRSYAAPVYGQPSYGYSGYGVAPYETYEAPVVVQRDCWRERRPAYDDWGRVVAWRSIRVCE
jgi:hypothetical protein